MEYKIILGIIAISLSIIAFTPYIYNIFRNKTKPHAFSWFLWGLLAGIAFFAQLSGGGGIGAWVTGINSALCLFIAGITFVKYKISYVKRLDWFCFFGAIFGIIIWLITDNPLIATIIVAIINVIVLIPTFRKAYNHPHEETATTYGVNIIRSFIGILALQTINLTTWLFPATLIFTNSSLLIMLIIRRNKI